MKSSVTIETTGMEEFFRFYAAVREKTIPEAIRINARLLCVELARRTQPFGFSDSVKKTGEKAITRDLLGRGGGHKGKNRAGIFAPLTPFMQEHALFYNSSDNIWLFAKKDGTVYGTDKAHFMHDASFSTVRSLHKANFVNGKMSAAGGDTHNIGRWKFINKYFVMPNLLKEYMASIHAKVGMAKSGWAWCAKKIKSTTKGSATRGIPRWVTRHLGDYGLGIVQDNTDNPDNPSITLTNTAKHADATCRQSERDAAVVIVKGNMLKQVLRMLKYERKKLQAA
jgi:hypothetical protein